jgi:ABC-type branched-subunit amino acid transport system substrate-binding protein
MLRRHPFAPVFIFALTLLLALGVAQAQQTPTFRIGILAETDSPLALGSLLAIEQINAAGGVRGADGTQFLLQPVLQSPDVEGNYQRAIANLSTASVVAVIGPETTAQVQDNLSPLLALNRPILTPARGNGLLLEDNSGRLFRTRTIGLLEDRALAQVLVSDLGVSNVQAVLLDETPQQLEALVGFSTAAQDLGASTFDPLIETPSEGLITTLIESNPQAVALFGAPQLANEVVIGLRNARYPGLITYNDAEVVDFRGLLTPAELDGIVSAHTWSYALSDPISEAFILDYVRYTGVAPTSIAAAAYDSVLMVATALEQPGELGQNLLNLTPFDGVQGRIGPTGGETLDSVVVVRHLFSGGQELIARFEDEQRVELEDDETGGGVVIVRATPTPRPTNTPVPTATLDGVYATVVSQVLNVRTGPGTNYDVLGQLREGETVRLIGANVNFTWAVIEFRGGQGWISTEPNLLSISGDRRTLPVVTPPPSPTPGPTSTPAPTTTPSTADLFITGVTPAVLTWNSATVVTVGVRNGGGAQSGGFTIAGGFEPGPVVASVAVASPGLAAGQSAAYTLNVTLTGATGFYTAPITVDFLNQVNEGGAESNNTLPFSYKLDRAIAFQGSITIPNGGGVNLDGVGGNDISFNGSAIGTTCGTCIVSLSAQGLNFESSHHDIVSASVNTSSLGGLAPGLVVGVRTDNGQHAVLRIDGVDGSNLVVTYRVYQ